MLRDLAKVLLIVRSILTDIRILPPLAFLTLMALIALAYRLLPPGGTM